MGISPQLESLTEALGPDRNERMARAWQHLTFSRRGTRFVVDPDSEVAAWIPFVAMQLYDYLFCAMWTHREAVDIIHAPGYFSGSTHTGFRRADFTNHSCLNGS